MPPERTKGMADEEFVQQTLTSSTAQQTMMSSSAAAVTSSAAVQQTMTSSSAAAASSPAADCDDVSGSVMSKRERFINECLRQNILLEGYVALCVIEDPSRGQVFESSIARARFYDPLGDLHSIVNIVRSWCNSLRVVRRGTESATWCESNGLNLNKLRVIENWIQTEQDKTTPVTQIRFNRDISYASTALSSALCMIYGEHLCVTRGHKGLGYVNVKTEAVVFTDSSLVTLANKQPQFVLAFGSSLVGDSKSVIQNYKVKVNILSLVDSKTAETILADFGETDIASLTRLYFWGRFTVASVGPECGALIKSMSARNEFCPSIRNVAIEYHPSRQSLVCFCPVAHLAETEAAVKLSIENIRITQLASARTVFPYPHAYSPLKIQLGPGLACTTVLSVGQFCDVDIMRRAEEARTAKIRGLLNVAEIVKQENCSFVEEFDDDKIYGTFQFSSASAAEAFVRTSKAKNIDAVPSFRHALHREELVTYANPFVVARAVWSDHSCANKRLAKKKVTESCRLGVHLGIERLLTSYGLKLDGVMATVMPKVETFVDKEHLHCISINITFPFYHCARVGIEALTTFAESNSHCFELQNKKELNDFVRTVTLTVDDRVYDTVRQSLNRKLDHLLNVEKVLSRYNITRQNGSRHIELIATKIHDIKRVKDVVDSFVQPLIVKIKRNQSVYFQTPEGRLFIRFLSHSLGVFIHRPEYLRQVHVYGSSAKKDCASKQILDQGGSASDEAASALIVRWYLVDFTDAKFCSDATVRWINEMEKDATKRKSDGDIRDWVLDVENMHLWIQCTSASYEKYAQSIECLVLVDSTIVINKKEEEKKEVAEVKVKEPVVRRHRRHRNRLRNQNAAEGIVAAVVAAVAEVVAAVETQTTDQVTTEQADQTIHCGICWISFSSDTDPARYVTEACAHTYCRNCFLRTITAAVDENRLPALCLCSKPFSIYDLCHACNFSQRCDVNKLLQSALRDFIFSSTDYQICPRANCPGILPTCRASHEKQEKHPLICLYCSSQVCCDCKGRYHAEGRCNHSESAMIQWMKESVDTRKRCAKCKMGIEKVDGCNNVYCVWCKNYTCWTCAKFFSPEAQKCYDHLNAQHGGY